MDTSVLTDVEQKRQTHEDALETTYTTFVNLMKGHMNAMLKDRPHEYNIVSKVETYLHKVYTNSIGIRNRIQYFRWNGILDLELSGRHLSDLTMSVLFQLLAGNNLIQQIRMLKLQSNLIASSALKALLIAYFPEVSVVFVYCVLTINLFHFHLRLAPMQYKMSYVSFLTFSLPMLVVTTGPHRGRQLFFRRELLGGGGG